MFNCVSIDLRQYEMMKNDSLRLFMARVVTYKRVPIYINNGRTQHTGLGTIILSNADLDRIGGKAIRQVQNTQMRKWKPAPVRPRCKSRKEVIARQDKTWHIEETTPRCSASHSVGVLFVAFFAAALIFLCWGRE